MQTEFIVVSVLLIFNY